MRALAGMFYFSDKGYFLLKAPNPGDLCLDLKIKFNSQDFAQLA